MYQELIQKYDAQLRRLEWQEGFWMGFTTGAIVTVVLFAVIRE